MVNVAMLSMLSLLAANAKCEGDREIELAKLAWRDRQHSDCANWLYKARTMPKEHFKKEVEMELAGTGNGTPGDYLIQAVPEPDAGH